MTMTFPAMEPADLRAVVGVVSSGDLEVLLEPGKGGESVVTVNTSVDGGQERWRAVLERVLGSGALPSVSLEINDSGATPGVIRLRLAQAFDEVSRRGGEPRWD